MAAYLPRFLSPLFLLLLILNATGIQSATQTHNFDITWVRANPDGQFERSVMGINNQWPIPALAVTKGDRVIVTVNNKLGNETTSLHWHGLYMNGTTHMDGPVGVTQCEIAPGASFVYNFTVSKLQWFPCDPCQ